MTFHSDGPGDGGPSIDPQSVHGLSLDVGEEVDVLVVGGGAAGLSAALAARRHGLSVILVDEHPVDIETMAESVPLHYGGRMGEVVRNRNLMTERMLDARPAYADAYEAGVDLRLSTACLGLYVPQPNLGWLPGTVALVREAGRAATLVRCRAAVVATGRRDRGLAFPGWDMPGVLGATAALQLAHLYGALDGRRAVLLGTGPEAAEAATALAAAGVAVAAVVEAGAEPVAPHAIDALRAAGTAVHLGTAPARAEGGALSGVERLVLLDGTTIACDLVVLATGAVPVIDLLDAAGADTTFDAERGGHVPRLAADGVSTSLPGVFAAGDCAGLGTAAEASGRAAADAAVRFIRDGTVSSPVDRGTTGGDTPAAVGWRMWVEATLLRTGDRLDTVVCQCEGVTADDLLALRAPAYVGAGRDGGASARAHRDQDRVKRITRAGMGPCQGRRCREQVQALLAIREGVSLGAIPLARHRAPVRPVPLGDLAASAAAEDPRMRARWDSWFGMPLQWQHFADVEPHYTVAAAEKVASHASE